MYTNNDDNLIFSEVLVVDLSGALRVFSPGTTAFFPVIV